MKKLISLLSLAFTLNSAFATGFVQSDWNSDMLKYYSFEDGNVEVSYAGGNALNYVGAPLKMSDGSKLTFGISFDNDKLLTIKNDNENIFSLNPFFADIDARCSVDLNFNSAGNMLISGYKENYYPAFSEIISGLKAGETSQLIQEYVVQGTDVYVNISINSRVFKDILLRSDISNEDSFKPSFALIDSTMEPITMNQFAYTGVVPEPATYAAIFGALALCFAAWRKNN